jgi:hypothetical protein
MDEADCILNIGFEEEMKQILKILPSKLIDSLRVLIICLLDSIICLLYLFVLTRFSSKHQSFLPTRFIFMLTRFLTMLARYAKLVHKFYFTSNVDFYACNFKRIYAFK